METAPGSARPLSVMILHLTAPLGGRQIREPARGHFDCTISNPCEQQGFSANPVATSRKCHYRATTSVLYRWTTFPTETKANWAVSISCGLTKSSSCTSLFDVWTALMSFTAHTNPRSIVA